MFRNAFCITFLRLLLKQVLRERGAWPAFCYEPHRAAAVGILPHYCGSTDCIFKINRSPRLPHSAVRVPSNPPLNFWMTPSFMGWIGEGLFLGR